MEFTKETMLAEVLEKCPEAMTMFRALDMHCMGCAMASGENIEEACEVHGVNVDLFVEKLNEIIAARG